MPPIRPVELHPIIVHFPIALLILSVAFDFLGVFLRRWGLTEAATWLLVIGAPSAGLRYSRAGSASTTSLWERRTAFCICIKWWPC